MSSYISAKLRQQILAQAHGRCAYCQSQERLMGVTFEIDHIIPRSYWVALALHPPKI